MAAHNESRTKRAKVRTGCLTCKIRKVKCDETKPACNRCTSTGRACDGYILTEDGRRTRHRNGSKDSKSPSPDQIVHRPGNRISRLTSHIPAQEQVWLVYFSQRIAPALSFVDGRFWKTILPQLGASSPAIRYALVALSSTHWAFGESGADPSDPRKALEGFGIKYYNKSVATLRQTPAWDSTETDHALVCCLLYICLECLYGNRQLVLEHLRNGLNVLSSKPEDTRKMGSLAYGLSQIFRGLDAQAIMFGRPCLPVSHQPYITVLSRGFRDFDDIEGARTTVDELISSSLNFVQLVIRDMQEHWVFRDEYRMAQYQLQGQLLRCGQRLDALYRDMIGKHYEAEVALTGLRISQRASLIYLTNATGNIEMAYDTFLPQFAEICDLAEHYDRLKRCTPAPVQNSSFMPMPSIEKRSTFAVDGALLAALFLIASKCRHPRLRRRASRLLETSGLREVLWDARLYARVARRLIEIEEVHLDRTIMHKIEQDGDGELTAYQVIKEVLPWPDHESRIQRADIAWSFEGPSRTAHITFFPTPAGKSLFPTTLWAEHMDF